MGTINLRDSRGRDAAVTTASVRSASRIRWADDEGRQASNVRVLKATVGSELEALIRQAGGLDPLIDLLIREDPEVDLELHGRFVREASRVYIDPDGRIVHAVTEWEVVRSPDGTLREQRPRVPSHANVNGETPLPWTGRLLKKAEVYNRFVFAAGMQITHFNGLTYDFLFRMARELEVHDSLLLVGAGPKGRDPLVFRRNGSPYRGFLEGRTQGDRYCLLLHLSNLELRAPEGRAE